MINQAPATVQFEQHPGPLRPPYLVALALLLLALPALALDIPLARYIEAIKLPGDLRDVVRVAEVFAHGWGVLMILTTVAVLAPNRRRQLLRVIASAAGSGLTALLIKSTVARQRPHGLDLHDFNGSAWSTFEGWAPWLSRGGAIDHQLQSFPSGHTATAVGLAVGLSFMFPRGRWLFAVFAVLAAMQRIDSGAHFLSDTLAAGALGCLIGGFCTDQRIFGRWFDRWEAKANKT